MKKLLCIFLAVLMLTATLVGCSKSEPEQTEGTVSTDPTTETEGLQAEDFGDAKGNPRDFMMLVRASRYRYLFAESDDADVVARASYERNVMIEEMFNIAFDITEVPDAAANWNTILTVSTGEFDLACFDYLYRVEEMGLLQNILELPELDLTDDYWYHGWNEVGTVNGQLYSVAGDASNEMVENMSTIFFNKSKASVNKLDMYSLVDNGEWTLEKAVYDQVVVLHAPVLRQQRKRQDIAVVKIGETDKLGIFGVQVRLKQLPFFRQLIRFIRQRNHGPVANDSILSVDQILKGIAVILQKLLPLLCRAFVFLG